MSGFSQYHVLAMIRQYTHAYSQACEAFRFRPDAANRQAKAAAMQQIDHWTSLLTEEAWDHPLPK